MTAGPAGPTGPSGPVSSGHAAVPLWRRCLAPADGQALGLWLATRLSLAVATLLGAALLADDDLSFAQRWARWDFGHFESVTEVWYSGAQPDGYPLEAFFPGLPAVLWLLARLGLPLEVGGLLVSLVAGAVAVVALRRLADLEGGPGTGNRAVLALVLSPLALFLAAPYTEALFLACAVPAWLAARRGQWRRAALLATLAATVRVNGLFLAAALAVELLTSPHRRWRDAPWLALPLLPAGLFSVLLWQVSGDPLRWLTAQQEGWHRESRLPWDAWANTWALAFPGPDGNPYWAWPLRLDLLAVVLGVVLAVVLAALRRWGDLTWVGLQVAVYATSYWYLSASRFALLWWPLWVGLGVLTGRSRVLLWLYVAISAPVMLTWTLAFTVDGRWAG